jgi:transposase
MRRSFLEDSLMLTNRSRREPQERAALMTVEALMFSLRERGLAALKEPTTRRRVRELDDDQVVEVASRCQRLDIGRGKWSDDEIEVLIRMREELRR